MPEEEEQRVQLSTFERLLSDPGQDLLREVAASEGSDLALATRLRGTHSPDLVSAAMTQHELRRRAQPKFGTDAARMYFTPDGLEQATRRPVATHRADRVVAAGLSSAIDLGCGVGGDLVALARAQIAVTGVELDEVRAAVARANLDALGLDGEVLVADATTVDRSAHALAMADPARRDGAGRVFDPRRCAPRWDFVTELLRGDAVVKAAPGLAHDLVPAGVEAEWVSDGGDLVEVALWGGRLSTARHRATLLPSGSTLTDFDDPGDAPVREPGAYLHEPDPAVIRAGLVRAVAARFGSWLVDRHIAYLSSDVAVSSPFVRTYACLEELPYREKALRLALRERQVGTLAIKKRGVQIVPEQLRKRLSLRGDTAATIVLTRVAGAGRCFLVEPLSNRG